MQEEISVPVTQDDAPAEALESVTVKGNMDSYTYRVYLWDSVDNMTPLTGSISPDGPPLMFNCLRKAEEPLALSAV